MTLLPYEHIVAAAITSKKDAKPYILFLTKNGIIKKSELSEYNLTRNTGATAIKLDKGDEIVSVLFIDKENIGIASKSGNFIIIKSTDINPIGRVTRGVCGMKLNEGDEVIGGRVIDDSCAEIVSVSSDGFIRRSLLTEFRVTGRGTKGVKLQKNGELSAFLPLKTQNDILVISSSAQIRLRLSDIPLLGRGAQGVKSIKLSENSKILSLESL